MKVFNIFKTEYDLEKKVSKRFKRRLQMLYDRYLSMTKSAYHKVDMMKGACVAWAFFCAVEEGQVTLATNFENIMHGYSAERLEMEGSPIVFNEDDDFA